MTTGHNNPPDPIDAALEPYGDFIQEAEGWLDGDPVSDEAQMIAVDALAKEIRAAEKAVKAAEESEAKPLHDRWKAAKARYKPTLDDLSRIRKGLASIVDGFKRELARKKAEAEQAARDAARKAEMEAKALAEQAQAGDIEAQREAARAADEMREARAKAVAASKEAKSVKGLRTVKRHEVTDHRALLHWIARNDRDAVTAFVDAYAKANAHKVDMDGVKVWTEKEAF